MACTWSAGRQSRRLVLPIIYNPFHIDGRARTASDAAPGGIHSPVTEVEIVDDVLDRVADVFGSNPKEPTRGYIQVSTRVS